MIHIFLNVYDNTFPHLKSKQINIVYLKAYQINLEKQFLI
jgi:hypothetical protein